VNHDCQVAPVLNLNNPFFQALEAASGSAIKKATNVTDLSLRRLLTTRQSAEYLALSELEIHNTTSSGELQRVRRGRRLMLHIRDLDRWITVRKAAC